ncbi:MAG: hypothetical protein K2O70_01200, partial [Desulfovibrionaceae bacterium]|nr:hypothetical protein [Desulfovibrionaceae bacterium]
PGRSIAERLIPYVYGDKRPIPLPIVATPAPRRRGRPRRHPDGMPATGDAAVNSSSGAPGCGAGAA